MYTAQRGVLFSQELDYVRSQAVRQIVVNIYVELSTFVSGHKNVDNFLRGLTAQISVNRLGANTLGKTCMYMYMYMYMLVTKPTCFDRVYLNK
jgi:hypothetical protein